MPPMLAAGVSLAFMLQVSAQTAATDRALAGQTSEAARCGNRRRRRTPPTPPKRMIPTSRTGAGLEPAQRRCRHARDAAGFEGARRAAAGDRHDLVVEQQGQRRLRGVGEAVGLAVLGARVGADMTVTRQPTTMSELLAEKAANGGSLPQSSGTAWAAVTAPGAGSIWDKTAVEARVDPGAGAEQARHLARASRCRSASNIR